MQEKLYVYLVGLSDPVRNLEYYRQMVPYMQQRGIYLELSEMLERSMNAKEKAALFNQALRSQRYDWILDVSGGDLANLTLPYLDYDAYRQSRTIYAGFSDITPVLNALAAVSGRKTLLFPLVYQSRYDRLVSLLGTGQCPAKITGLSGELFPAHARVHGGNLRCFLKLAGTGLMPDLSGGFLVIEALSGRRCRIESLLAQLTQTGALEEVRGFVLGRFSELEKELGGRDQALAWLADTLCGAGFDDCAFFAADTIGHVENGDGIWISGGNAWRMDEIRMEAEIVQQEDIV